MKYFFLMLFISLAAMWEMWFFTATGNYAIFRLNQSVMMIKKGVKFNRYPSKAGLKISQKKSN